MVKNFAHRGFKSKYPENTLLAFEKAIEVGCDGIEFDVQLAKDGEVVIIHDETVDRTTDGKGRVKDLTYEQISRLNASYLYRDTYEGVKVPTLKEYFELVKDKNIISNIELKNSIYEYKGMEQKVYDLIMEYDLKDQVIISSFNHLSIMHMKKIDKTIKCGLLTDNWLINPGEYVKKAEVECFHPAAYGLTKEKVDEIKSYGLEVNVWIGSEEVNFEELMDMEIDCIMTDYPDIVKQILLRKQQN